MACAVPSVEWVVGDAEQLPIQDESMDAYTIAFGIRNCTRIEQVLKATNKQFCWGCGS